MGFFQTSGILNRRGFFGGGATAFKPSDITGLQLWLDATTGLFNATNGGNSVTTNASSVARWEDQSGNGRHATQSSSTFQPTLRTSVQNGRNIIRFDGTDDFYTGIGAALPLAQNATRLTFFMAVIPDFATRQSLYGGGGIIRGMEANTNEGWYYGIRSSGKIAFNVNAGTNACIVSTSTLTTNTACIIGASYDGSGGSTQGSRITNYLSASEETDVLDDGSGGWGTGEEIGRGYEGTSYYFKGDLCELVIYDSVLSSASITNVVNYLKSKWGIS